MNELVSIIIPVYNTSKYLRRCIDSLINQSYKKIEIIAIENGSTDNSLEILKEYGDKIILEILKKPSLSAARNKGIKISLGNFITFIDSDDFVETTYIEELLNSIKNNKSDLSICNISEIHPQKNKIINRNDYPVTNIEKQEIENNLSKFVYGPTAKLFKKDIIIKNNIEFPLNLKYEDLPFVLKYILHINKISKVQNHLYNYYIHSESEQNTVDERIFDILKILQICEDLTNLKSFEDLYVQTLTTYALKTRNIKDKQLRNSFIDKSYETLNQKFPKWKKSDYIQTRNFLKRIIQKNKKLVKIYTSLYYKTKGV